MWTWINLIDWCIWMRLIVWNSFVRLMNILISCEVRGVNLHCEWCVSQLILFDSYVIRMSHEALKKSRNLFFFSILASYRTSQSKIVLNLNPWTISLRKKYKNIFFWDLSIKTHVKNHCFPHSSDRRTIFQNNVFT